MANENLTKAKSAKNDEFYTQFDDIQNEMNAYVEYNPNVFRGKTILLPCNDPEWSNFTTFFDKKFKDFGIKKVISISIAPTCMKNTSWNPTDYEKTSPQYDELKSATRGKVFWKTDHSTGLKWDYLDGDGNFQSEVVKALRDEADLIITNPPFSLFREFMAWIMEANKKFAVIGNQNAITYKEIFPLIKANKCWLGATIHSGDRAFNVPDSYPLSASTCGIDKEGKKFIRVKGVRWFTNIGHGLRHQPLNLITMKENLSYSKHKEFSGLESYLRYDNYDAIEVPYTNAIPSDYDGVMGVPITFLDKYCPEQFEIVDARDYALFEKQKHKNSYLIKDADGTINGKPRYVRICIRKLKQK